MRRAINFVSHEIKREECFVIFARRVFHCVGIVREVLHRWVKLRYSRVDRALLIDLFACAEKVYIVVLAISVFRKPLEKIIK